MKKRKNVLSRACQHEDKVMIKNRMSNSNQSPNSTRKEATLYQIRK